MMRNRRWSQALLLLTSSVTFAACAMIAMAGAAPASAGQQASSAGTTVWDGVFTAEQAKRGERTYSDSCSHCHEGGVEAPAIVGESFLRAWFEDGLDVPFRKISETMPPEGAGSLSDSAYRDVLSYLLEQSGFPSGQKELPQDPSELARIQVVGKEGPGGPVPNYSLVAVVGCLSREGDKAWMVTNATRAVRTRESGDASPEALKKAAAQPLGTLSYRFLPDFMSAGAREAIIGHKVLVKGRLVRQAAGENISLSTLQSVSETCAP